MQLEMQNEASNKYSKHRQNENEANDVTSSQMFDAKQQCWKNVDNLTSIHARYFVQPLRVCQQLLRMQIAAMTEEN